MIASPKTWKKVSPTFIIIITSKGLFLDSVLLTVSARLYGKPYSEMQYLVFWVLIIWQKLSFFITFLSSITLLLIHWQQKTI
jgi:hypothetical protein